MLSNVLAPMLARHGIHYGWLVAAATFATMLSTAAAMGMPGVMLLPLHQEFGWSTSAISGALALRLVLFGLAAPFAAAVQQRYGVRATVIASMCLIVGGLALASTMTELWQLWLYWGVMVGAGTGMTAMVLGATIASRWFVARRGLVIGVLTASNATGQLAFLPLAASLTTNFGWRVALIPALVACAVAAVLMVLVIRDYPADVGLPAFGDTRLAPPPPRAAGAARLAVRTLADASGEPVFWMLFATFFVCGLSTNGLIQTHFISLCADYGMAAVAAASMLALMGAFDFVGTIASGWLSDRYDPRWLLFWYYGLRGLSLLYLPFSGFGYYGLAVFAVFYGLDWIATVPPTVKLAGQYFGRDKGPMVFGWVFAGHQLGAAAAALAAGVSRDLLASYLPAFFVAGLACIMAALAAVTVRRARRVALA